MVTAVAEAAIGAALLLAAGTSASLLLGATLNESGAMLVARICGAALIAIGIACLVVARRPAKFVGGRLDIRNAVLQPHRRDTSRL
jgi:hypothetical protein